MVKRRSAAQTAAKELELAQDEVRRAQERRATGTSPRVEKAAVSARALLLAGAFPLVPANLVPRGTNPAKLYGEHTPMALSPGGTLVMFERRWEGRRGWVVDCGGGWHVSGVEGAPNASATTGDGTGCAC